MPQVDYVNSEKRLRRCADIFGSDQFSSFAEIPTNIGEKIYALTRISRFIQVFSRALT